MGPVRVHTGTVADRHNFRHVALPCKVVHRLRHANHEAPHGEYTELRCEKAYRHAQSTPEACDDDGDSLPPSRCEERGWDIVEHASDADQRDCECSHRNRSTKIAGQQGHHRNDGAFPDAKQQRRPEGGHRNLSEREVSQFLARGRGVEGVGCRLALEEALAIKGGRDSREPLNRHVGVGILAGRKLCQRFPRTHDYPARQAGAPPFPGLLVREPPEVGQVAGADLVEAGRSAGAQGSKHRDVPLHVAAGIQHTVADGRGVRPLEVDGGAVFDQLGLRQEGGDSPEPPHIGFLGLIVDHRPLHGGFDQASHYGLSQ